MSLTEAPGASREASPDPDSRDPRKEIVELLTSAYWMEIETVMNYIAASITHSDARGLEIKAALIEGVEEEVEHARRVGRRIQELCGVVPAASETATDEECSPPPPRDGDIAATVDAVIAAENVAIRQYGKITRATAHIDEITNAIAIEILGDEQRHLRRFEDFQRKYAVAA